MCRLFYTPNFNKSFNSMSDLQSFIYQLERSNGGHGDGVLIIEPQYPEVLGDYADEDWVGDIIKLSETEYVVKTKPEPIKKEEQKTGVVQTGTTYTYHAYFHDKIGELLWRIKPTRLFFHTRLASAGSKNVENIHPQIGERYVLFQNGTIKFPDMTFEAFGLDSNKDSDTKLITTIINTVATDLQKVAEIITKDTSTFLVWDRIEKKALVANNSRDLVWIPGREMFASEAPTGEEHTEYKKSIWIEGEFVMKEEKPKVVTYSYGGYSGYSGGSDVWSRTTPLRTDMIKTIVIKYNGGSLSLPINRTGI